MSLKGLEQTSQGPCKASTRRTSERKTWPFTVVKIPPRSNGEKVKASLQNKWCHNCNEVQGNVLRLSLRQLSMRGNDTSPLTGTRSCTAKLKGTQSQSCHIERGRTCVLVWREKVSIYLELTSKSAHEVSANENCLLKPGTLSREKKTALEKRCKPQVS